MWQSDSAVDWFRTQVILSQDAWNVEGGKITINFAGVWNINAYIIHESIAFLTSSLGGSSIPTYIRERRNPENKWSLLTREKTEQRQKSRKEHWKLFPRRKLLKKPRLNYTFAPKKIIFCEFCPANLQNIRNFVPTYLNCYK